MKENIIGVDIGATNIRLGLINDSKIVSETTFPTLSDASEDKIIDGLINEIERIGGNNFAGIGIGVPGLIDEEKGIVYDLWNIASWREVHLKRKLEDHFNKPVKITNDANLFALGEKRFGKGKPYKNMVGVSLGTGFGTGIIINGKIYSGTFSGAGEMADIPYLGKNIEDYCSGKFFRQEYGFEGAELYKRAEKGDQEALRIFGEFGKHLGESIKLILYMLAPQAIFLGGSVSRSYRFFEESMMASVGDFPFKRITEKLVIAPAGANEATLLGAASLFTQTEE